MRAPQAAAATDPGRERSHNEDRVLCEPELGIFAVIDGVGGESAGEVAAETALEVLRARLSRRTTDSGRLVREAIALANRQIYERAAADARLAGMSCVLTVVVLDGAVATIGHVGDSRLYALAPGDIRKVTPDHSPVGAREDAGDLSEIEAMRHPRRNEIFRDVGSSPHEPDDESWIDVLEAPLPAEGALLLCSDGLSDMVAGREILETVEANAANLRAAARALVERANRAGGRDNISVVLVAGDRYAEAVRGPRSRRAVASPATAADMPAVGAMSAAGGATSLGAGASTAAASATGAGGVTPYPGAVGLSGAGGAAARRSRWSGRDSETEALSPSLRPGGIGGGGSGRTVGREGGASASGGPRPGRGEVGSRTSGGRAGGQPGGGRGGVAGESGERAAVGRGGAGREGGGRAGAAGEDGEITAEWSAAVAAASAKAASRRGAGGAAYVRRSAGEQVRAVLGSWPLWAAVALVLIGAGVWFRAPLEAWLRGVLPGGGVGSGHRGDVLVVGVGDGGTATIGEALARARPGQTVEVAPGRYRERVVLREGVALVSRVPRGAVLLPPEEEAGGAAAGAVAGGGVAGAAGGEAGVTPGVVGGAGGAGGATGRPAGPHAGGAGGVRPETRSSAAAPADSSRPSPTGSGTALGDEEGAAGAMAGAPAEGFAGVAVLASGVHGARLSGFRILGDNRHRWKVGIRLEESDVSIEETEVADATVAGIQVSGADRSTVRLCYVHQNAGPGISVGGAAAPRLLDNLIAGNGFRAGGAAAAAPGVEVRGGAALPLLAGNHIEGNNGGGVTLPAPDRAEEIFRWNAFGTLSRDLAVRLGGTLPAPGGSAAGASSAAGAPAGGGAGGHGTAGSTHGARGRP